MRTASFSNGWRAAIAVACLLSAVPAIAQKSKASTPPLALVNGRILTQDAQGVIERGTVIIHGGRVTGVGADIEIPKDARRIDVSGFTVSPGLIDARSTLWVVSDSVSASASDASLDPKDALDMYSEDWKDVAAQGVTAVCLHPGGSLGGRCVVVRVAPAADEDELTISESSGVQASLGVTGRSGNASDRYAQYEALKKSLEAARKYQEQWKKYREALKKWEEEQKNPKKSKSEAKPDSDEKKKPEPPKTAQPVVRFRGRVVPPEVLERMRARGIKIPGMPAAAAPGGSAPTGKDGKPTEPKEDKAKELLVEVLEGKVPLRIEVHRADDAANALQLADDFKGVRIVLEGLSRLGRTWNDIRTRNTPLIAGPMVALEGPVANRLNGWFSDVSSSANTVAISTFSRHPRGSRFLRVQAAAAVAQGLDTDRALAAMTVNAARILGVADKVGSIREGKQADVAVFAGHPTDPAAPVILTISRGEITWQSEGAADVQSLPSRRVEVSGLPQSLPDHYVLKTSRMQQPDGTLAAGAVEIRDGRIVGLNPGELVDVEVFDVGDAVVTSGLVLAHAVGSTAGSLIPVTPEIHAADNFNPESAGFRRLTRAGFTAVAYAPSSSNVVAGRMGCVRFGATSPVTAEAGVPTTVAGKFVLSSSSRSTNRYPSALSGQRDLIQRYLDGEAIDTETDLYLPPAVDRALQSRAAALRESLLAGRTLAVFEAETEPEVRAALDMIEHYKLKGALLHPRETQSSRARMRQLKVGCIVRATQVADYEWYARDLVALSDAGIAVGVSATTPDDARVTVATLVSAGMSPAAALRALTSDAAGVCGVDGPGRLEADAPADLVVWTSSPVDLAARAVRVIVDGRVFKETP